MSLPAGVLDLQPGFLHELSMRLEAAFLRFEPILRSGCCERGAKNGESQDDPSRFLHGLFLSDARRRWLPKGCQGFSGTWAAFKGSIRTIDPIGYIRPSL